MASSQNSDLALAVLRVRVRSHIDVLRGSINEYFDATDASGEIRLISEQELDKIREIFEQAVRGSKETPANPDTTVTRNEVWSEFDSDAIQQPVLVDASKASATEAQARVTSGSDEIDGLINIKKAVGSEGEVLTNKEKEKPNIANPSTPPEDLPPRESVGLNFEPQSQSRSSKAHLSLLQKVRVPRTIRRRLSRIFKNTPKSTPASPIADTIAVEPADVGNLLSPSRHPDIMSWQAYVDTSLVGTGDVDKAAIFNSEGNSVWATTPGFTISPAEMGEVIACYKDNAKAFGGGFHVAGTKYVTIKADERSLYGKQGKVGIIIVKTKQAMLIAHHPETVQAGVAANTVEKLGDYLIGVGY